MRSHRKNRSDVIRIPYLARANSQLVFRTTLVTRPYPSTPPLSVSVINMDVSLSIVEEASEVRFHDDSTVRVNSEDEESRNIAVIRPEVDILLVGDYIPPKQLISKNDPPPPKSVQIWRSLPTDLIAYIATMLDLRSLGEMSRIDSLTSQTIKQNENIWSKIITSHPPFILALHLSEKEFTRRFSEAVNQLQLLSHQTPRAYILIREKIVFELDKLVRGKRAAARANQEQRNRICHAITDYRTLAVLLIILIPIFLISLLVQSMRDHSITFVTFWPIYALIFYITVVTTFFCWLHWFRGGTRNYMLRSPIVRDGMNDDELNSWFVSETFSTDSDSLIGSLVGMVGVSSRTDTEPTVRGHASLCLTLVAFTIWIVLITLRMTHTIDTSWTLIFIPIYFVFGCCLISPLFVWTKSIGGVVSFVSVVFLSTVILLHIRFLAEDHSGTNGGILLIYILIPLFLFDLFLFVLCIGDALCEKYNLRERAIAQRVVGTAILSMLTKLSWILFADVDHLVPIWLPFMFGLGLVAFIFVAVVLPLPDDD